MEFSKMTIDELESRKAEIRSEVEVDGADLNALEAEVRSINEEMESRKAAEAKRVEIRAAVAEGDGEIIKTIESEERKMTFDEIRSSKAYINAYADYIKTEDATECRKLLSVNADPKANGGVDGVVPVPTFIEGRIKTAWGRARIMELVRKTYYKGNLQVGFELSATGAGYHEEGAAALPEQELEMGIVTLIPKSVKKWITISDEALDMGGEEFLDYIYDELTYHIAKFAQEQLIDLIVNAPAAATATSVGVPAVTGAPTLSIVAEATAALADNADELIVVMNRQTHAAFIAAIAAGNFMFDPFEGYEVHYDNKLPAYASAGAGDVWMVVGDFRRGAQANFPNGDTVRVKYDDLSLAEQDLVKLVGREFVGLGLVADKHFAVVKKG